jgi:hypothetical protein
MRVQKSDSYANNAWDKKAETTNLLDVYGSLPLRHPRNIKLPGFGDVQFVALNLEKETRYSSMQKG